MPALTRFNGIEIRMYFLGSEHNPPHIHVIHAEESAAVDIKTCVILEGTLPDKDLKTVKKWIKLYEKDLLEMWESQSFKKLPPLI